MVSCFYNNKKIKNQRNKTDIKESRYPRIKYSIGFRTKRPFKRLSRLLKGMKTSENQKESFDIQTKNPSSDCSSHNFEQVNVFRPIPTQSESLIMLRRWWSLKVITLRQDSKYTSKDVRRTSHRITRIPVEIPKV